MTIRFENYFSFEAFALIREYKRRFPFPESFCRGWKASTPYSQAWAMAHRRIKDKLLINNANRFLIAKRNAGELLPVSNLQGCQFDFAMYWSSLVETGIMTRPIGLMFGRVMTDCELAGADGGIDERASYESMCQQLTDGNIPWDLVNLHGHCQITDIFCQLAFQNWIPVIGNYDPMDNNVFRPLKIVKDL
jgi:hypothetical protein